MLTRESCMYTSHYCEENATLLADRLRKLPGETRVVFVSNQRKQVPIWHQRAAALPSKPVVWDYHVLAVHRSGSDSTWNVFDLDSTLPWPCAVSDYIAAAFRPGALREEYAQQFRVLGAAECIARFSSDRRHMLNTRASPEDGPAIYLAPPPPYAPLRGCDARSEHELGSFLDFSSYCSKGAPASESSEGGPGSSTAVEPSLSPDSKWYGRLLTLDELRRELAG